MRYGSDLSRIHDRDFFFFFGTEGNTIFFFEVLRPNGQPATPPRSEILQGNLS